MDEIDSYSQRQAKPSMSRFASVALSVVIVGGVVVANAMQARPSRQRAAG